MEFIFVDPSGSFTEGKGHTGIAIMEDEDWSSLKTYSVDSKRYKTKFEYWSVVIDFLCRHPKAIVIIESFTIRNNGFLIGKMPETIRFIGAIEHNLDSLNMTYLFQMPTQAKSRFKDEDLSRHIPGFEYRSNGRYYLNNRPTNDHIRDALKHMLYFHKYNKGKVMKSDE